MPPLRSAVTLALLLTLALAGTLRAHGVLRSSHPANGARLAEAPRELRLRFNEAPVLAVTRISLRSDSGDVTLGPVRIDSTFVAVAPVEGRLVAGNYVVRWQTAGADGHPVRGEIRFSIAPGAAGLAADQPPAGEAGALVAAPVQHEPTAEAHEASATQAGRRDFDASSPGFVGVRALLYAALVVVVGAVTFRHAVLLRVPELLADGGRRAARLGRWSAAVAIVAIALRLVAQWRAMHGDRMADVDLLLAMLSQTLWGWGWIAQCLAAIVAYGAFRGVTLNRRNAWSAVSVAALVLAFSPSLASHAAASPRMPLIAMFADGMHVLAASAWLGGLLVLFAVGIPAAREEADGGAALARLVGAFTPVALAAAATLVATGVFAAWLHLGSVAALAATTYGRVLLLKLAAVAGMAIAGFYNWRVARPRMRLEGDATLRKSMRVELAFGVAVTVATAVLVALPVE